MWSPSTSTISMTWLRDGLDRASFAQVECGGDPVSGACANAPPLRDLRKRRGRGSRRALRPLPTGLAGREALAPLDLRLGRLVEFERPAVDVACSFVDVDRDAGFRHLAVDQHQSGGDRAVAEESLAASDHQGEDPHAELVDEVVLKQGLHEARAAVDLDL